MRGWIIGAAMVAAGPAMAWGDNGHRIVCKIAYGELNPAARAEVDRLIALDPQFTSFGDACTWPDHPRRRGSEHFVNIGRDAERFGDEPCPTAAKCVVSAIATDLETLRGPADDAEKLATLKTLGHWLGDIHQPLHVSFEDDRGGNQIKESGPCRGSLHAAWDSCIIERSLGTDADGIAATLAAEVSEAERATWNASGPVGWASESLAITRLPSVGYCVMEGRFCGYDVGNPTWDDGEPQKVVKVDDVYVNTQAPAVRLRLKQAGIRLGALLNRVIRK